MSNTSPTLQGIVTLKSSNHVYTVWCMDTLIHFINQNVAESYDSMHFPDINPVLETSIFIETPPLDDFQPRLKIKSPTHETIPRQASTGISRGLWGLDNLFVMFRSICQIMLFGF